MKEKMVFGDTLPEAYHEALIVLHDDGEITDCADWNTEQKELSMTMCVRHPLAEPMISRCFIGGPQELEQYTEEMLDGILDFEVDKGKWTYTYHRRFADQIDFVINDLKRNPSSRRAVMVIRDKAVDMGSDDPSCLQLIQYFIRDGKLDCKVLFRSNDACKATFMNAYALIRLQERIANRLGVEVGSYVHRANSFHCYEKDFDMLDGYVKRIRNSDKEDVTFDYEDGWDELMDDAKPAIAAMVEELKTH